MGGGGGGGGGGGMDLLPLRRPVSFVPVCVSVSLAPSTSVLRHNSTPIDSRISL